MGADEMGKAEERARVLGDSVESTAGAKGKARKRATRRKVARDVTTDAADREAHSSSSSALADPVASEGSGLQPASASDGKPRQDPEPGQGTAVAADGQNPEDGCAIRLREIRMLAHKSQAEIGALVGLSGGAVSNWERGVRPINSNYIVRICRYLGCTPNDLLGYEGELTLPRMDIYEEHVYTLVHDMSTKGKKRVADTLDSMANDKSLYPAKKSSSATRRRRSKRGGSSASGA
ncbi:MAG: helix-turn-helix domain-containing protein [Atopobiaceae bacterium]